MKRDRMGRKSFLCAVLGAISSLTFGMTIPFPPPPEVTTLMAAKEPVSNGVRLTWSDGTAPYVVVRSETPDFSGSLTIYYVSRAASAPADDPNVLGDSKLYYYQIYDVSAEPTVLAMSVTYPAIGDTLTIDGAGFDPAATHVYLEGEEIPVSSVSATQLQLSLPATSSSGQLTVLSSTGVSQPRELDKVYFKNHADLTHVAVDTNHDIWACERGTAATSDKIYKVDHLTGGIQSWATLNECVGLPADSAGNHYVGNSISNSTNRGSIWKIDTAGASTSWGVAGIVTTYPVYVRALATDPGNNGPSNLTVYTLDGNNTDHSSSIIATTASGHAIYLSIGTTIPNPGGLAINILGHMFYTLPASIVEMDSSKALVFTYDTGFNLNNPAQIDAENAARLWVANRGANNILRISTDPAGRKVLAKVTGLTSPRGVAFDHDPTIDPVSGLSKSYVYVAEQTRLSRFRVYDTVWVSIKVLNEATAGFAGFPAMSHAEMEAFIMKDIEMGRAILKQAGIELRLRGSITWIDDPNSGIPGHSPGWVARYAGPGITSELQTLFATSRSSTALDINVYYVLAAIDADVQSPQPSAMVGETFTNDLITGMNNETEAGIVMTRFNTTPEATPRTLTWRYHTTLAHEVFHFLMDSPNDIEWEHHAPDASFLMNPYDDPTRFKIEADRISNAQNNADESAFIERF